MPPQPRQQSRQDLVTPWRTRRPVASRFALSRPIAATALAAVFCASAQCPRLVGATAVSGAPAATGSATTVPPTRRREAALVFRVEGSSDDPEFVRACGVVKGLEDLYGKERYLLHPVPVDADAPPQQRPTPKRRKSWMRRLFCGSRERRTTTSSHESRGPTPTVLCSIDLAPTTGVDTPQGRLQQGPSPERTRILAAEKPGIDLAVGDSTVAATATASADTSVAIGGVEDLLEFVRNNVLAGPRPFSFAFHEQSLRITERQRRKRNGGEAPPGLSPAATASAAAAASLRKGSKISHPATLRGSNGSKSNSDGPTATADTAEDGARTALGGGDASGPGGEVSASGGGVIGEEEYEYDLVVIGGGSGGLACAKEAARLGQKVACLDFVKPSAMGSKWGLGGTCVNVGCIPKKLMHQASLLAGHVKDAPFFGWRAAGVDNGSSTGEAGLTADGEVKPPRAHDWEGMVQGVQNYIKGLNFKYRTDLRSKGVEYINALGRLEDAHRVVATDKNGKERVLSCGSVVVAVGGRPNELPCEGGELALTSDDIFSLKTPPGKTLVVGASYVALECAGFLTGLGVDTTVMVRSLLLRGFDQGIAERIGSFMEAEGTRFLRPAVPHRITKTEGGRLLVSWREGRDQTVREEEFDTVLAATGRTADTRGLGLERLGVALSKSGKMICRNEETTVAGVFGIGDAVEGVPELTPSAVQAGRLLAMRLFGGSAAAMDYSNVCTTVFTPLEYGCCGLSEEEAIENLGEDNVEVYHSAFTPLEWQLNTERPQNACYVKAVCDLTDRQRVVGLHFLGPNAGEEACCYRPVADLRKAGRPVRGMDVSTIKKVATTFADAGRRAMPDDVPWHSLDRMAYIGRKNDGRGDRGICRRIHCGDARVWLRNPAGHELRRLATAGGNSPHSCRRADAPSDNQEIWRVHREKRLLRIVLPPRSRPDGHRYLFPLHHEVTPHRNPPASSGMREKLSP